MNPSPCRCLYTLRGGPLLAMSLLGAGVVKETKRPQETTMPSVLYALNLLGHLSFLI